MDTPCYAFHTETGELAVCTYNSETRLNEWKFVPVTPDLAYLLFLYIEKLLYGEAA